MSVLLRPVGGRGLPVAPLTAGGGPAEGLRLREGGVLWLVVDNATPEAATQAATW